LGAEGLAVPPREELEKELFHAVRQLTSFDLAALMPLVRRIVQ
jgi:hypothetical protein